MFAETFLNRWLGNEYWCVDDYKPYGEMPYDREADFLFAVERLKPHAGRVKMVRMGSVEASALFAPGTVDFIYIDGAHDYESVRTDLHTWYPKLTERGIIAGHDFDDIPHHAGVKRAVEEFGREVNQTVYLTAVPGFNLETCPSWYLYRSGMPGPGWRRC